MGLPTGAKVFNVIRENASQVFMDTVPSASEDNIQTISNILFNDAYQPQLNEFVNNLINRIALTIVRNKSFDNPLSMFKKGSVPLGTDIQEIYENPAVAEQYEISNTAMAKLLTVTDPDTHVAYYRRNRKDLYTKTIAREALQGAFKSWGDFSDFVTAITNSLWSGNYIDEFKLTKALIDGAYDNNKVIVETVSAVTDEASGKALVEKMRSLYSKMRLPSTAYNAYSKFSGAKGTVTTWTDPSRIVVILTADVEASIDVNVLARAFNMEYTDFLGRVIVVDEFENPNIKAVICDEAWLQIYDNVLRFDEFYNARTMSWNEYLHAWGTFAISPFANAVVLATALPTPATAVSFGSDAIALDLSSTPTYETIEVTITPTGATSNIEYVSTDESVFTVKKNSNTSVTLTPVAKGTASIKGMLDGEAIGTQTVNVTE